MGVGSGWMEVRRAIREQNRVAQERRDRRRSTVDRLKGEHTDGSREAWVYNPVVWDGAEYRPGWQKARRLAEVVLFGAIALAPMIYLGSLA